MTQGRPRTYSLDQWIASVTSIIMISNGNASNPCDVGRATGFFYNREGKKYLITNRHVIIDEKRRFYPDSLKIQIHTSNVSWENRDIDIPLYDENQEPKWLEHSGRSVDVAAINVDSYLTPPVFISYWSKDTFLSANEVLILGSQTLILGYPMGFYDEIHNFPIVKSGTLASPYRIYFQRKPFFLIDAKLQPGTSGSPVILQRRSTRSVKGGFEVGGFPPILLGINSSGYSSNGIELGLNRVWYPSLIEDILSN